MATAKWLSQFNMLRSSLRCVLSTRRIGKFRIPPLRSLTEISFTGFVDKVALLRFKNLCFFIVWAVLLWPGIEFSRPQCYVCLNFSGRSLNKDWIRGRVKHIPHQHRQQSANGARVRFFFYFGWNLFKLSDQPIIWNWLKCDQVEFTVKLYLV